MKLNCRCLSRVCCFVPFVDSFINATVTPFFTYFPRKGKINYVIKLLCFTYDGSILTMNREGDAVAG